MRFREAGIQFNCLRELVSGGVGNALLARECDAEVVMRLGERWG